MGDENSFIEVILIVDHESDVKNWTEAWDSSNRRLDPNKDFLFSNFGVGSYGIAAEIGGPY